MLLNTATYFYDNSNQENAINQANDIVNGTYDFNDLKADFRSGVLSRYLEQLPGKALELGIKIVFTIIVVIIGYKLIGLLRRAVRNALEKTNLEKGVIQFTDSLLKTLLTLFLIIGVAVNFGMEATSIAALISSVSIAIGLALQGSLSNFAGGILLLALKPFKVGDYIKEDTHGNEGTVKEISMFYTKLLSYDNKTIVLPNGILANSSMVNYSDDGKRKIDLCFDISYNSDIKKTREIILEVIKNNKKIYQNMQKSVFVSELGESGIKIGVRCFTDADSYFKVYWQLLEDIKYALDANDIKFPYPQMDVHFDK